MTLPNLEYWTFNGIDFPRMVDGATWPDWFTTDTIHAQDQILGSDESYLDIGGTTRPPLTIRAAFLTLSDRAQLAAQCGQVATLINIDGEQRSALLQTLAPVGTAYGLYLADLTFKAI